MLAACSRGCGGERLSVGAASAAVHVLLTRSSIARPRMRCIEGGGRRCTDHSHTTAAGSSLEGATGTTLMESIGDNDKPLLSEVKPLHQRQGLDSVLPRRVRSVLQENSAGATYMVGVASTCMFKHGHCIASLGVFRRHTAAEEQRRTMTGCNLNTEFDALREQCARRAVLEQAV